MNELQFNGKISLIKEPRVGSTERGEWANVEFEVTEKDPKNPSYPQIALFVYFKNGDYVKYARDFKDTFKVGDEVTVHFNLGKTVYQKKDGTGEGTFYKTSAWKVDKIGQPSVSDTGFEKVDDLNDGGDGDLPF